MAITLRSQKGSPLTFEEMDGNFTTLSGMTGGGSFTGGTVSSLNIDFTDTLQFKSNPSLDSVILDPVYEAKLVGEFLGLEETGSISGYTATSYNGIFDGVLDIGGGFAQLPLLANVETFALTDGAVGSIVKYQGLRDQTPIGGGVSLADADSLIFSGASGSTEFVINRQHDLDNEQSQMQIRSIISYPDVDETSEQYLIQFNGLTNGNDPEFYIGKNVSSNIIDENIDFGLAHYNTGFQITNSLSDNTASLFRILDNNSTNIFDVRNDGVVLPQGLLFDNSSRLREGTIDAGSGGGIAQICGAGYELKWEGGVLYVMNSSGNQIRQSLYNSTNIPTSAEDDTKGYVVGSIWGLDDLTYYSCSDNSTGAAVWDLVTQSGGTTSSLSDVLAEGNSTGANDISIDQFQKIFNAFDVKGNDFENRIEFGGSGAEFKIISENVDANTGGNEPHQAIIKLSAGELNLRNEIKGDGDTIPNKAGDFKLGWISVDEQNEPIVQMQVDHLVIGGGASYDQVVKVTMVLPTSSSGLTTNQLWNDNGTVKIIL